MKGAGRLAKPLEQATILEQQLSVQGAVMPQKLCRRMLVSRAGAAAACTAGCCCRHSRLMRPCAL